ncbi:hypothetical protein [Klenkia sp. PcliD-1-E]|uniref:hypothetical protein n=1 Tax=Klenkia sp. PcliD-1-E TaxID=2954492 RepID=UPI002096AFE9|nr:hypothetical protein [Klenkia sp. PcliD-1-E]MCO7219876.1 hypothetical protein [Klenkia sp. PcliD-1-E]
MQTYGTGRETTPVVVPGPDGDLTGEQLTGPVHAVPTGSADLELATSLCNHEVRAVAGDPFDPAADDVCPVCAERAR